MQIQPHSPNYYQFKAKRLSDMSHVDLPRFKETPFGDAAPPPVVRKPKKPLLLPASVTGLASFVAFVAGVVAHAVLS